THVTFDDIDRDLNPPADVSAFDVPGASGVRHRVVAIAANGERAEGFAREVDGVASPEEGFVTRQPPVAAKPAATSATPSPPRHSHPKPISTTTRDGFTRLK
ncbi:MAG: hypothetical protein ABI461_01220, partial [Polyangiaceae bacterium]